MDSRSEQHPEQGLEEYPEQAAEQHPEQGLGESPEQAAEQHPELAPPERAAAPHAQAFVTGGAYALLFLFGAAQGLIGCFQFSWGIGQVPLAALGFCAAILATCLLGAAAMGSAAGALLPAVGWFFASLVLTMPTAQGSVIVTNTAAGEWYLYGGSACAAAGVVIAFVRRIGAPLSRRGPAGRGPARGGPARGGPASGRGPAHGQSARGAGL